MAQNPYQFSPGKYDPVTQTDVVDEQAKSNQRVLDSELQFLDEMNERDDALVEKTRSEWESLTNLSSSFAGWLEKKAEKDKKEKLQKGSYLALITPASKEDIKALTDRENGLKDSHLRINEIANRIEETTGSYELAQQFRNLSGWEQYAYVKASLVKAANGYGDFKNEARNTTFIKDAAGNEIGYDDNPTASQQAQLNAKVRFKFAEQFIGVNEELLSATVGTEILKIDAADDEEAQKTRDENAKKFAKEKELNAIESLFVSDPAQSRANVDFWIESNIGNYKGVSGARMALRTKVVELVQNGDLSLIKARAMVKELVYHSGDKKGVSLEKWKEFEGFDDELVEANAKWQQKRLDTDTATVKANAEALRDELTNTDTVLTVDQKKQYLKRRFEEFPDVPLSADEQFIIYGYRDDDTMRSILLQKAETFGGITAKDLEHASPTIRNEFKDQLLPDGNQQLISINSLGTDDKKFVTDMVSNSAKSTGALDAKNLQYYALLAATEEVYVKAYNDALVTTGNPIQARDLAQTAIVTKHSQQTWVDENSNFVETERDAEYEKKLVFAQRQVEPETGGYATRLLEAPQAVKDELSKWAAAGGKGPVPYYYQKLANDNNILPRELAWRQAGILGYEGQWDEKAEVAKFNIPKNMLLMFLNKPTKNKKKRFEIDVNNYDKDNTDEVHTYEDYEEID